MSTYVAARFSARSIARFPVLDPATPTILVTLSDDANNYEVNTNIGQGMTAHDATQAIGYALHMLSHALLGGETVDLTDLDKPLTEPLPDVTEGGEN